PVPHLHFDEGGYRHMSATVPPDRPRLRLVLFRICVRSVADLGNRYVLPARAVDESYVGPVLAVSGIRRRTGHNSPTAHIMVVDRGPKSARQLPSSVIGTGRRRARTAAETKRHQLIFRVEIRLRDPANSFGRVVHCAGEFITHALGAPVNASGIGIN